MLMAIPEAALPPENLIPLIYERLLLDPAMLTMVKDDDDGNKLDFVLPSPRRQTPVLAPIIMLEVIL